MDKTVEETKYACGKHTKPELIFAVSRLCDNENLIEYLLTDSKFINSIQQLYCTAVNPSVDHTRILFQKSGSISMAFSICAHQQDPNIRELFIRRIASHELNRPAIVQLEELTLQEARLFISLVPLSFALEFFYVCPFFDDEQIRLDLLERESRIAKQIAFLYSLNDDRYMAKMFETFHVSFFSFAQ